MRFEIAKSSDGKWYVSIVFTNGNRFSAATGYNRKANAIKSAESVQKRAAKAKIIVVEGVMSPQQQIEELRQQVAELLAWKAQVEAVWPQIVENL